MAKGMWGIPSGKNEISATNIKASELPKGFLSRRMVDIIKYIVARGSVAELESIPCRSSSYLSWQPAQDLAALQLWREKNEYLIPASGASVTKMQR